MLASYGVIPFDSKPFALLIFHFADIADCTSLSFCRQSFARIEMWHVGLALGNVNGEVAGFVLVVGVIYQHSCGPCMGQDFHASLDSELSTLRDRTF